MTTEGDALMHNDECQYWSAWSAVFEALKNGNPPCFYSKGMAANAPRGSSGIQRAVAEIKRLQYIEERYNELMGVQQ